MQFRVTAKKKNVYRYDIDIGIAYKCKIAKAKINDYNNSIMQFLKKIS